MPSCNIKAVDLFSGGKKDDSVFMPPLRGLSLDVVFFYNHFIPSGFHHRSWCPHRLQLNELEYANGLIKNKNFIRSGEVEFV